MLSRTLFKYAVVLMKHSPAGTEQVEEEVTTYWSEDSAAQRAAEKDGGMTISEAVAHAQAATRSAYAKMRGKDEKFEPVSAQLLT